jgi:hypothetical protein
MCENRRATKLGALLWRSQWEPVFQQRAHPEHKRKTIMKKQPQEGAVFGIDFGKNSFHVVGWDGTGQPIVRTRCSRDRLLHYFVRSIINHDFHVPSLHRLSLPWASQHKA